MDYRKLNDHTPMPVIEDLLSELHGAQIFSKIDRKQGYFQILIKEKDMYKTAFINHNGLFEFKVMPFGLTNAPVTFQNMMNDVFAELLRKFVLVFFNDILVYSPYINTHVAHLTEVLRILEKHQLYAKKSKCAWGEASRVLGTYHIW